jgi:hypothetical protein
MSAQTNWLKGLFGRKKSFRDLQMDELRRESIRLEQLEAQLVRHLEQIEEQKRQLFQQGSRPDISAQQRLVLASKIKQADAKAKNEARNIQFVQKQLQVITGLIQLKENEALWAGSPLLETLARMDLADLERIIEEATVEGSFQTDRLIQIITKMEEAEGVAKMASIDKDTMEIYKYMEQAAAMSTEDPSAVELAFKKMNEDTLKTREEPGTEFGF